MKTVQHNTLLGETGATFSDCGKYRYLLWRTWDKQLPRLGFVLLNPSKADDIENDPTVARCVERSKRLGYGSLMLANAFAWRETDRKLMLTVPHPIQEPFTRYCDHMICKVAADCELTILGWGLDGGHQLRSAEIVYLLERVRHKLRALAFTSGGEPGHPLYLPYSAPLLPMPELP